MKFGAVPLADALGAILAHGVPAASLAKGIVLGQGHLDSLAALGMQQVTVARPGDDDVDENTAAQRLADALVQDAAAQGLVLTPASHGRVNIRAHRAGLLELDVARLVALNRIDPMITLATLPQLKRVTAGVMVATIKIISYAVATRSLDAACSALADAPYAMTVRAARLTRATLIETHHAGARPQPKGRRALDERLDRLGARLVEVLDVPHDTAAIAAALAQAKGQVVFILTASATSDAHDTAPTAVRDCGGTVLRYGMPVDPGNLLFIAQIGRTPVIGLPGCARSLALNGADHVLERVLCGLPVGPDDISAMGIGGLLKDIPDRGRPRG